MLDKPVGVVLQAGNDLPAVPRRGAAAERGGFQHAYREASARGGESRRQPENTGADDGEIGDLVALQRARGDAWRADAGPRGSLKQ